MEINKYQQRLNSFTREGWMRFVQLGGGSENVGKEETFNFAFHAGFIIAISLALAELGITTKNNIES